MLTLIVDSSRLAGSEHIRQHIVDFDWLVDLDNRLPDPFSVLPET